MTDELIIDEKNFSDHFFDARKHPPRPGQVLACYDTVAEFVDGNLKRDVLHLLLNTNKAESAQRLIQKIACATADSSLEVTRQMTDDLLEGLSPAEVAAKPYRLHLQLFYYTLPSNVPDNDPKWWSSKMLDCKISGQNDVLAS